MSLFQEAKAIAKPLRLLMFGASLSEMTKIALGFPNPVVIDSEHATDLFAGRSGMPAFKVMRTRSLSDTLKAVAEVERDDGKTFGTLVIDSITPIYEAHRAFITALTATGELAGRDWNRLNEDMKGLYDALNALPCHVVLIAREAKEYEGNGPELKPKGHKPDGDKQLPYVMDFVLRLLGNGLAEVRNAPGVTLGVDGLLVGTSWASFEGIANTYSSGLVLEHRSEKETVAYELELKKQAEIALEFSSRDLVTDFLNQWAIRARVTPDHALAALGVAKFSEWKLGRAAADDAMEVWVKEREKEPVEAVKITPPSLRSMVKNGVKS
jgi:hypothetical protein